MARHRGPGRRCTFESLENRRMLAGDVTARIVNGDLVITGDKLDNGITIVAGTNAGEVIVTGVNAGGSATNVNGTANGAVTLAGFTGDLKIKMKAGNDSVSISNLNISGEAKLHFGKGDDTVSIVNVDIADDTDLKARRGSDDVTIEESTFTKLDVSLSKGDDSLSISDTTVSEKARLKGGKGTNSFANNDDNSFAAMTQKDFDEESTSSQPLALAISGSSSVSEGATYTLSLSATGKGSSTISQWTIKWGDGSADQVVTGSPASVTHTFKEGPNSYSISATATNPDGTTNAGNTVAVTVNNAVPTISLNAVTAIVENGSATLTGSFTDPGVQDPHTLTVNWGDPNSSTNSVFAIGATSALTGTPTFTSTSGDGATLIIRSFDATTGLVSFSVQHKYVDDGLAGTDAAPGNGTASDSSTISVTVSDDDTGIVSATTSVTINNQAPSVSTLTAAPIQEGGTATVTGTFTDVGLRDLHGLKVNWGDPNNALESTFAFPISSSLTVGQVADSGTANDTAVLTITSVDAATGTVGFSIQRTYADDGLSPGNATTSDTHTITVTVTDDDGQSGSATTTITINNVAPTLSALTPATQTINEGSVATVTTTITEPSASDVLTVTVNWQDGATDALTLSTSGTGTVGGTTYVWVASTRQLALSHTYLDGGASPDNRTVTVTVKDDDSTTVDTKTATVTVNNIAPSLTITGPTSVTENASSSWTLGAVVEQAPDTVTSYIVRWGDGSTENFTAANMASMGRVISHTYADGANSYTISVDLVDEDGTHTSAGSLGVVVNNIAPTLSISGATTANEGALYTLNLSSSDPGVDTITKWTINWGDGTGEQVVSGNPTSTSHTYADNGNYNIIATATDEDGTHAAGNSVNVVVQNVVPILSINGATTATEGSPYTLNLSAVEPGADTITQWTINWGDGTGDQVVSGNPSSTGHTYADNGNYNITATATDEDGTHAAGNSVNVAVQNVAPALSISGAPTVNEGSSYTLNLSSVDPGADTITKWTITWGDGSAAQVVDGNPANVSHTYADNGNYTISATATDEDGEFAAGNTVQVAVTNVAPTLSIAGPTSIVNSASSNWTLSAVIDPGADTVASYVINWGDGDTDSFTAAEIATASNIVSHSYAGASDYTISVDLIDEDGTHLAVDTLNVTVSVEA